MSAHVSHVSARQPRQRTSAEGDNMTAAFTETDERLSLRREVAKLAGGYGREFFVRQARSGGRTTDLWRDMGRHGYLGVAIPEEHGGGGGGIGDLAAVCEELAAAGCPLLMMIVSPAICGTVVDRFGTQEQQQRWLPGSADGTLTRAFAITEPDAGSNSHKITTTARRDGDDWILSGQKVYISGVDQAQGVLVVGRAQTGTGAKSESLRPALFVVPTDTPGMSWTKIDMEIVSPENQFQLFLDDVRLL